MQCTLASALYCVEHSVLPSKFPAKNDVDRNVKHFRFLFGGDFLCQFVCALQKATVEIAFHGIVKRKETIIYNQSMYVQDLIKWNFYTLQLESEGIHISYATIKFVTPCWSDLRPLISLGHIPLKSFYIE